MRKRALVLLLVFLLSGCTWSKTTLPLKTGTKQLTKHKLIIQTNPIDQMEMVLIPAGRFFMGISDQNEQQAILEYSSYDEGFNIGFDMESIKQILTEHEVELNAFWLDRYEVTNEQYKKCVDAGVCEYPEIREYYSDELYKNHPVVYVAWNDANTYCEWAGRRLPTEAEWEHAARGKENWVYPWGDVFESSYVNVDDETTVWDDYTVKCSSLGCDGYDLTSPVGQFPQGMSGYGVYDMAGNVAEWVADWYGDDSYNLSQLKNPTGPNFGTFRVVRGSSWNTKQVKVFLFLRYHLEPSISFASLGFRCAVDSER